MPTSRRRIQIGTLLAVAAALGAAAAPPARAAVDARVLGSFAMVAHVTTAVNVSGERAGQTLRRTWSVAPAECAGSVCGRLILTRQRSRHVIQRLTLNRTGPGTYAGSGSFWVALRCRGRTHRLGSHAPFRITLTVAGTEQVQNVVFARTLTATYDNPRRSNTTRCPLGPSHDAATYAGSATTPVPGPPTAGYTDTVDPSTATGSFTDASQPGQGGAPIVAVAWNFGDPASGPANTSSDPNPQHRFSAPGSYSVTLAVSDANGLVGQAVETVTVPPPPVP